MKNENLVNAVMNEVNKLGLAHLPDTPMFEKSMRRSAEELYELIDEGEFKKASTVVSRLESIVITFVDSLWFHNHISFVTATELKGRFHQFAEAKRSELWDKKCRKDDEESIDYDEFDRHINEKIQEVYRECDEMKKAMNQSSKPSTIIIIMK